MAALLKPLNREEIAWGVRINDEALRGQLNELIARWKADGTLDAAILKWIPYYDRLR